MTRPSGPHRRRVLIGALAAGALVLGAVAPGVWAQEAAPDQVVKGFYDTLVQAMRQGRELGFSGRFKLLDPAIRRAFDLAAMTRISIGPQWRQIDADTQARLQKSFADWTIATYASQFSAFDGEVFAIGETVDAPGKDKLVKTTLTPKAGEAVMLNYLMRAGEGGWRIVDVYLTGSISELATRRSEFTAILKSDGPEGLVRSLEARVSDIKAK